MNLRNLHKDNHPDLFPQDKIKLTFPTKYADIVERVSSVNANAYGKTRNFLWGKVSYLSPYISRGVISLPFVKDEVLKNYNYRTAEKWVSELAWREFFQRIWQAKGDAIHNDLRNTQFPIKHKNIPSAILEANTGIHAIDEGIQNLIDTGYMHNHMRMYTAMLTTNMGQAHWYKPAQWMYYHLLDHDAASNHLSWQWVAGAFSSKKYIANQENINKYTGSNQTNTFLDRGYEELSELEVPNILSNNTTWNGGTTLPMSDELYMIDHKPIFLYNTYQLDPLWHNQEVGYRILLLEPSHFKHYPISDKVLSWIIQLAKDLIPGIQIVTMEQNEFYQLYHQNHSIYYKEHPTTIHYKGVQEEREWMFPEVKGYFNSFMGYWKKCERYLH